MEAKNKHWIVEKVLLKIPLTYYMQGLFLIGLFIWLKRPELTFIWMVLSLMILFLRSFAHVVKKSNTEVTDTK